MPNEQPTSLRLEIGDGLFIDIVGYPKLLINAHSEVLEKLHQLVRIGCAAQSVAG